MANPSELQREDEHGPVKAGVVFERLTPQAGTVRMGHARIDRRTALPEHPAERAAREYQECAVVSTPEVAALRDQLATQAARIAELESLTANLSTRLAAASECLGRVAERRPDYCAVTLVHPWVPPSVDELREYAGEGT